MHTICIQKEDSIKTVLLLKSIYFTNIFIKVPPTTTKAKATKMYRKIKMTINLTIMYMLRINSLTIISPLLLLLSTL